MNFDKSNIKSVNLLSDFRKVTIEEVVLSCSWWNFHGHYFDKSKKKLSLGQDMNWSYLHFKNHVEEVLSNDVVKIDIGHPVSKGKFRTLVKVNLGRRTSR
jgi:hypothetical protein